MRTQPARFARGHRPTSAADPRSARRAARGSRPASPPRRPARAPPRACPSAPSSARRRARRRRPRAPPAATCSASSAGTRAIAAASSSRRRASSARPRGPRRPAPRRGAPASATSFDRRRAPSPGGRSGPRNGVSSAPPCTSPRRVGVTTVGHAARSPASSTRCGCQRPPATASSHQDDANADPCGERRTRSS